MAPSSPGNIPPGSTCKASAGLQIFQNAHPPIQQRGFTFQLELRTSAPAKFPHLGDKGTFILLNFCIGKSCYLHKLYKSL